MGLFKTIVIGAAVYGTYKFFTEKDSLGKTRLDDLKEQAPEWLEKIQVMKDDLKAGRVPEEI